MIHRCRPIVVLLCLCLSSVPAFAHAHLRSAVPAADSTVATAPGELDLSFTEGVNPAFSGVRVTGPDGAALKTGTATLGGDEGTTLVVTVAQPLAAGTYHVDWHALAKDGHRTAGRYSFTLKP